MMTAIKLSIYVNDADRHGRRPLYHALVELLHREGIAGVTVLHGMEGFGESRHIHTTKIELLALSLPVVVVAIDEAEKIEAILPLVGEIAPHGLVTTEEIQIATKGK